MIMNDLQKTHPVHRRLTSVFLSSISSLATGEAAAASPFSTLSTSLSEVVIVFPPEGVARVLRRETVLFDRCVCCVAEEGGVVEESHCYEILLG